MSVVWAFIKDDKGYVFSDGKTSAGRLKYDKTFKEKNLSGDEFIGGITGCLDYNLTFNVPVGNSGPQGPTTITVVLLDEMKSCITASKATNNELLIDEINTFFSNHLNVLPAYDDDGKLNSTHFLIITPWKSLIKVDILYSNIIDVKPIYSKNESIGDENSYLERMTLFNSIYSDTQVKYYLYHMLFSEVKFNICGNTVGGKTFHQTLP